MKVALKKILYKKDDCNKTFLTLSFSNSCTLRRFLVKVERLAPHSLQSLKVTYKLVELGLKGY